MEHSAIGGLAFHCPCCKEARALSVCNPFDEFTKMGHKKRSEQKKMPLKKLNSLPPPEKDSEVTALTAQGLAHALGFSPADVDRAGFRAHRACTASVSWDDATEMRRLVLKDIVMCAALQPLLVLQCAARVWRARARVKRIREQALKSSVKRKKKSRGLSVNMLEQEQVKEEASVRSIS